MTEFRLMELGGVEPLHSQTIYHAVCHGVSSGAPDTLIILHPSAPYVCIGYHQELDKEVDVAYCERSGIPIYRRQVGGGAVYLDSDQIFFQLVVHRDRARGPVEQFAARVLEAPVRTYRQLGIDAYHRPVNDICVGDRKISGTGMARIEEAVVLVGNIIFDFNYDAMVRVLQVSSEKLRDKVYSSLRQYLTTTKRELGRDVPRDEVQRSLVRNFSDVLSAEFSSGDLTDYEVQKLKALDRLFLSKQWLYSADRRSSAVRAVKIRDGAVVSEVEHKSRGGLIRMTLSRVDGKIADVAISGDFLLGDHLDELEQQLRGKRFVEAELARTVNSFYRAHDVKMPLTEPMDFVHCILKAS